VGRDTEDRAASTDRSWVSMTLTYVGDAGELLEGGGGKMSPVPHDSGDTFKPPGQN
jgi:hypothetical protein